jgi:hypothetical protein
MLHKKSPKIPKKYSCGDCDYVTSNKKDFDKHSATDKHQMLHNAAEKSPKIPILNCECGKKYKQHQSLYRHKKICKYNNDISHHDNQLAILVENNIDYKQVIHKLIEENGKLVEQNNKLSEQNNKLLDTVSDLVPKIGNNNTITNNNITNNNNFNIQIFLNEDCKDAISMIDFVKSLEISLENLITTKKKGLAEGITNIFIESMNKLPITQRPMHCTDAKRETLYIKNDKWEKDEDKTMIKEAIKNVSKKQVQNIHKFKEAKPNYMQNDNEKEEFIYIVKSATDDIVGAKEEKVIKNLCKNVYINEKIIKEI